MATKKPTTKPNLLSQLFTAAKKARDVATKKPTEHRVTILEYAINGLRGLERQTVTNAINQAKQKGKYTKQEDYKGLSKVNASKLEKLERDYANVKYRLEAGEKYRNTSVKNIISKSAHNLSQNINEVSFVKSLSPMDVKIWGLMCEANPKIQDNDYPSDERKKRIKAIDIIINAASGKNGKVLPSKRSLVNTAIKLITEKDYRKYVLKADRGHYMFAEDSNILRSIVKSLLDKDSVKQFYAAFS